MILIDTNILVAVLRGKDAKVAALVKSHPVAACGVVRSELLHGVRNSVERTRVIALLATLGNFAIDEPLWDEVGDNLALVRSNGIAASFQDIVLATLAINKKIEFWTRDADFQLIQKHLPLLRLFIEPP